METFTPATTEPSEALLDAIMDFLRNGHSDLHDPAPPAWAEGDPCPAGHFTLPEGLYLYRADVPQEAATPFLCVAIAGDCERHVVDDDRYWNIPVAIHYLENRDTYQVNDTPAVLRELQNDLLADASILTVEYPAAERMSTDLLHVFYLYDVQLQPVTLNSGHPAHTLLFKVRCSGKTS